MRAASGPSVSKVCLALAIAKMTPCMAGVNIIWTGNNIQANIFYKLHYYLQHHSHEQNIYGLKRRVCIWRCQIAKYTRCDVTFGGP